MKLGWRSYGRRIALSMSSAPGRGIRPRRAWRARASAPQVDEHAAVLLGQALHEVLLELADRDGVQDHLAQLVGRAELAQDVLRIDVVAVGGPAVGEEEDRVDRDAVALVLRAPPGDAQRRAQRAPGVGLAG